MAKSALITFGNEESYGLSFVGGELLEYGQDIKFFDGERDGIIGRVLKWKPDFLMFSPLTTFYPKAAKIARFLPEFTSVFGGHHALASPDIIKNDDVDVVVKGPVRGSVPRILNGERGVIETLPTCPADMPKPARREYFRDIPRIAKRYRKFVLSMLGCPWNCSYCSSSSGHIKQEFGEEAFRNYYLQRRPIEDVIAEIEEIMRYDTQEIEWVDDDIFTGDEGWLLEFVEQFAKKFPVTMYVSTTSASVLKASDELLRSLRRCVNVVGMGIQAIRPSSLRLFNRQWDNEKKMKAAYDRLVSFGYRVNLQAIVGLPVTDPIEDAMDTILAIQRISAGSICSIYPLMVYPGTKMEMYCADNGIRLNPDCNGDTNSATCHIAFDDETQKQLRNICKLATFFVKYDIDEKLMRALIRIDYDAKTSQQLSMLRYRECVVDRLGEKGKSIFNNILGSMKLKF